MRKTYLHLVYHVSDPTWYTKPITSRHVASSLRHVTLLSLSVSLPLSHLSPPPAASHHLRRLPAPITSHHDHLRQLDHHHSSGSSTTINTSGVFSGTDGSLSQRERRRERAVGAGEHAGGVDGGRAAGGVMVVAGGGERRFWSKINVSKLTVYYGAQMFLSLGVAYSKHIVHLYSYQSDDNNIDIQIEIEDHVGGVNDLVFSKPNEQLYVITCGDDKLIRVWDVTTGVKQYVFEGHEAPVYSICSHVSNGIHFSTSKNKFLAAGDEHLIKVWDMNNVELLATIDVDGELVGNVKQLHKNGGNV
ncbi:hypothetical protein LguiA_030294 [Lonicera macranthoides]